jgi:hypothetical protein
MAVRLGALCFVLLLVVLDGSFAHKHEHDHDRDDSNVKDLPSTCHETSSSKHCKKLDWCDWCSSSALPSGCYHLSETTNLAKCETDAPITTYASANCTACASFPEIVC